MEFSQFPEVGFGFAVSSQGDHLKPGQKNTPVVSVLIHPLVRFVTDNYNYVYCSHLFTIRHSNGYIFSYSYGYSHSQTVNNWRSSERMKSDADSLTESILNLIITIKLYLLRLRLTPHPSLTLRETHTHIT